MIVLDVRNLALNLVLGTDQPFSVKEAIASRIVEAAIEIVNDPTTTNRLLDHLVPIYEGEYRMVSADLVILDQVNLVRKNMRMRGWDNRLMVKGTTRTIGKALHHVRIEMDLDATLNLGADKLTRKPTRPAAMGELVSDNPSSDTINELNDAIDRESRRELTLYPTRSPMFVKDRPRAGWGNQHGDPS